MTYNTSSPTVKCEKCEEHLTDFEQYEKHMAHMHGLNTLEESVVDWTLITDEDIITKDGNKYRVGGESINWSPNFDKEARIFLEEKYQKGKIEMLSKKKISEAKKFVKALESDTNQHYDNLINKIEGKGEDSYKELFPNKEQKFPQNKMPTAKWFSHQRDEAGVTDVGIQDQGYFDDPNAVMGSQTKRFSKGKYHIDEPVAKEQFSTSFYGEYLGESKAREHRFVLGYSDPECNICGRVIHNSFEQNDDREAMQDAIYQHYNYEHSDIKNVKQLAGQQIYDQFRKTEESKANEYWASTLDDNFKSIPNGDWGDWDNEAICNHCGRKFTIDEIGTEGLLEHLENEHGISEAKAEKEYPDYEHGGIYNRCVNCGKGFAKTKKNPHGLARHNYCYGCANKLIQENEELKANEDAIGSDIDFGKLLNETPYDEQQRRFRTARDEQSPLDNIYHSKSVADDIAGGTQDTYAQDFIGGYDGKALYDNYADLDDSWFYDSTGVQTKKVWESIAKEDLESEKKEWINAREELLKGNREPLLELVDRGGGDVELMKESSVADALEQIDMELESMRFDSEVFLQEAPPQKWLEETPLTNKFGIEYEYEWEYGGLYRDLYSQQIDEGDEEEVFELLEKYDNNNPYASDKDMADEIERKIGWLSGGDPEKDALTLVHQWKQTRF